MTSGLGQDLAHLLIDARDDQPPAFPAGATSTNQPTSSTPRARVWAMGGMLGVVRPSA